MLILLWQDVPADPNPPPPPPPPAEAGAGPGWGAPVYVDTWKERKRTRRKKRRAKPFEATPEATVIERIDLISPEDIIDLLAGESLRADIEALYRAERLLMDILFRENLRLYMEAHREAQVRAILAERERQRLAILEAIRLLEEEEAEEELLLAITLLV